MTSGPRFAPLKPNTWPQDNNKVPSRWSVGMPTISPENKTRSRQESFAYPSSFTLPTTIVVGQQITNTVPVDKDGDFWVDQIFMCGWGLQLGPRLQQVAYPLPGTVDIIDAVTGHSLTWPAQSLPTAFLANIELFSDDTGFDVSGSPYPTGWRSTGILAEPYCFTRGGAIQITLSSLAAWTGVAGPNLTDICLSGWKEYEYGA